MSYEKYIFESSVKNKKQKKEYFLYNEVLLLLQHSLQNIDIQTFCKKIQTSIPKKLFKNIDYIYIGKFDELDVREVESAYLRGAIYISDNNLTEDKMYKSLVHELAHSVEELNRENIYGDSELASEFVAKRKKLRSLLKAQGIELKNHTLFLTLEYNNEFDNFLYKTVGYDLLNQLCVGLFVSPYAATSLREYFANGFENFYLDDKNYLQKISPKLYSKIFSLTKRSV